MLKICKSFLETKCLWTSHIVVQPQSHSFPQLSDNLKLYCELHKGTKEPFCSWTDMYIRREIPAVKPFVSLLVIIKVKIYKHKVCQAAFWPTQAELLKLSELLANITRQIPCICKERIVSSYQLSLTLIQIDPRTRSWLQCALLPLNLTQWGLHTDNCQKEGLKAQRWWGRCEMFYITANVQ